MKEVNRSDNLGFSYVYTSLPDENYIDCSYAVVSKKGNNSPQNYAVLIILKNLDIAILDYNEYIQNSIADPHYLLIKQHFNGKEAYNDFLSLIGKMCKKDIESKYFRHHIPENNRMLPDKDTGAFIMVDKYTSNSADFNVRLNSFKAFIKKQYAQKSFTSL